MRGIKELLFLIAAVAAFAMLCFGLGVRTGMQVQKEIQTEELNDEWEATPPCPYLETTVPTDSRRLRTDI